MLSNLTQPKNLLTGLFAGVLPAISYRHYEWHEPTILCASNWSIADLLRGGYKQSAKIDAELKLTTDRILEMHKGLTA